jgi:hypothetical protein
MVTLEISNDCLGIYDSVSYPILIEQVSLNENFNRVTIYPNPTIDYLNIELVDWTLSCSLDIIDMSGRNMLSKKININNSQIKLELEKGIYYVKIYDESDLIHVEKIIIL